MFGFFHDLRISSRLILTFSAVFIPMLAICSTVFYFLALDAVSLFFALTVVLLLLILGLIITFWLSRVIAKPLHRIMSGLSAGAIGDFSIRLPVGAQDEMGQLAWYFNDFMDKLQAYSAKLKDEIRDRKSTEKVLCRSQGLFDVFMDHLPALAYIKDQNGRYLFINAACKTFMHRLPGEVIGKTDAQLWPQVMVDQMQDNDQKAITGNKVINAVEIAQFDDERRYLLSTKFPIEHTDQDRLVAGVAFDISDKVRAEKEKAILEEQLIQAQKMEAIGTLAGGIAHDFNNILAAIFGYVEIARLDADPQGKLRHQLDQVLKAAHRAKDLVRQILTFSRKNEQDRRPLDPAPLIKEALKLIRASLPATIEIQQDIRSHGQLMLANATQLHQVVMNLCANAAHAMEASGGILSVCLKKIDLNTLDDARQKGVSPGNYLELTISDTGHGINSVVMDRIFDPYFTTKGGDQGTGMGLAVAHGIVTSHNGVIQVHSEPNKGAIFKILFPVTSGAVEMSVEKVEALPRGEEKILFVDDEAILIDLGKQMLTRLGYQVECRASSIDALEIVRLQPDRFDLVITDLTMPNMTGDMLARRIIELRSDLPVILCTGYSEQISSAKTEDIGIAALLMKPLTIGDLARTVRNVLDDRPQSVSEMTIAVEKIYKAS